MELLSTDVGGWKDRPGYVRLRGMVRYADGGGDELWFAFPESCIEQLSGSGDPWFAALLPLAVHRQEPLRLHLPVDARLLGQAQPIMELWHRWFSDHRPVRIDVPSGGEGAPAGDRVACCFSGGVDSFFSLLSHESGPCAAADGPPVDDLVYVWGFDLGLAKEAEWNDLRMRLAQAAAAFGKTLLAPITNLRATRYGALDWGRLGHGPAIAAVFLALQGRLRLAYVPASLDDACAFSWGSHHELTPRFSTRGLAFRHDGGRCTRMRKLELVARHPAALKALQVCWESRSGYNCGTCEKCLRTMAGLEAVGTLDQAPTFPMGALDLPRLHRMFVPSPLHDRQWREVEEHADANGHQALAAAVRTARFRSTWIRRVGMFGQPYLPKGRVAHAVSKRLTRLLVKAAGCRAAA